MWTCITLPSRVRVTAACPLSLVADDPSAQPSPPSSPSSSVTLLSPCVPAIVVYYCTFQGTVPFSSVTQSCLTLCDSMDCSMPGFPVHHQLLKLIPAPGEVPTTRYCTIGLEIFSLFLCMFFIHYLCEKYYKPITVQYYTASCIGYLG